MTSPLTLRVCGALILVVVAFASAFHALEGWSPIDCLYFTTTTLATIGFGDLRPSRPTTRALTSLVGICGVGLLGSLVSAVIGEWAGDGSSSARARRWPRLPSWAQATLLLSSGTLAVKLLEGRAQRWADCIYLVAGAMTTAGLGDVVPTTAACKCVQHVGRVPCGRGSLAQT